MSGIRLFSGRQGHDPRERLDIGIGAVGFFAVVFFVVTLVSELTGADALGWALTLLAFVIVLALLLAGRRRMTTRMLAGPDSTAAPERPAPVARDAQTDALRR
ncbi:hypothetical protein ACX9R5_17150 [Rathayibacter sp. CAU 1779]